MPQKWEKNPEKKNPNFYFLDGHSYYQRLFSRMEQNQFSGICSEIVNKRAGPNKRAGWNFFQKVNKRGGPNKSEQDGKTSKNK